MSRRDLKLKKNLISKKEKQQQQKTPTPRHSTTKYSFPQIWEDCMDNQQGPTVEHKELCSKLCGSLVWKGALGENGHLYTYG